MMTLWADAFMTASRAEPGEAARRPAATDPAEIAEARARALAAARRTAPEAGLSARPCR